MASTHETTDTIRSRFEAVSRVLDERQLRWWAAAEARAIGRGGITAVAVATGISRRTVRVGIAEVAAGGEVSARLRKPGAGRKRKVDRDPHLVPELERLVDPQTRGDPMSPLRWTCKSTRKLAAELTERGHPVSADTVGRLLRMQGYSLQANRKTREGSASPDRNEQFETINRKVLEFQQARQPVISVDTKKKELVGDFKNGGREWNPKGKPEEVRTHDFAIPGLGRANPYGVYDVSKNVAWVSVGTDHDTSQFAVESVRRWWNSMGRGMYPQACHRLLITADGGGSNGSRVRLYKVELQRFADETGLAVSVSHLPPGTSKWNKIEHRLFSFITQNWRGRPLVSHEVVVNLIAATATKTGLFVRSELDTNVYPLGQKVSDKEMDALNIERDSFHGEWNYTIRPR